MKGKRKIIAAFSGLSSTSLLWGGTGRPSDGLLSFILLMGLLLLVLGVLHLIDRFRRWTRDLLNGMY